MAKVKISVGRIVLNVDLYATPTAQAVLAAAPFESRVTLWPGEIYFPAPLRAGREDDAREVVEPGEIAFRPEGEVIIIGYGPTPCSEAEEIRFASRANVWGRSGDDLTRLATLEGGELVRVEPVVEVEPA